MSRAALLSGLAGLVLACPALADPVVVFQTRLGDHPGGTENPPPYGLRLDNIFTTQGGVGGRTTFSFEQNDAKVVLKVIDDGGTLSINISGTVYGGVDTGTTYGFGAGHYDLDFTFSTGVTGNPIDGWTATVDGANNFGSIVSQGDGAFASGVDFDFFQTGSTGTDDFAFLDDGHRLPGSSGFVGRGWFDYIDNPGGGARDFLFVAIPLPGSAGLAMAGLGLVAIRRRRSA